MGGMELLHGMQAEHIALGVIGQSGEAIGRYRGFFIADAVAKGFDARRWDDAVFAVEINQGMLLRPEDDGMAGTAWRGG